MATVNEAYASIANLNLWFKLKSGDELLLSDVPEIIPLRWNYFKDNWLFIKPGLLDKVEGYLNPDLLNSQIDEFDSFIALQRNSAKKVNPLADPKIANRFYTIFDNMPINAINITNDEQKIIDAKTRTVAIYSKNDFLNIKRTIADARDRFADTVNLSDASYNSAVGRSAIPAQLDATIVDANMLLTLQIAIKNVDFVLANLFAVDAFVDPFALARANANNPDIDIGQYSSGRLVKLNYGESLQDLAFRYFGDPNKWLDIAIANGLKPPYIDEVGTRLPLLSNGQGNQININATDTSGNLNIDRFYINQAVFLQSDTEVFPEQRIIINIREIPVSGEIILELDGEANLQRYKIAENANLRIYKPNTVNSAFFVLIPSTEPLTDDRKDEVPWFLAKSSESERRMKVDLALDDNGDLSFDTNGDMKLSYGLANAIQAIKLKMSTELGALRYHPNFGLVNVLGNKNNNIGNIKATLIESIKSQVEADPRFDRVENLSVEQVAAVSNTGPSALLVNLIVKMAGAKQVIPISFAVNY